MSSPVTGAGRRDLMFRNRCPHLGELSYDMSFQAFQQALEGQSSGSPYPSFPSLLSVLPLCLPELPSEIENQQAMSHHHVKICQCTVKTIQSTDKVEATMKFLILYMI